SRFLPDSELSRLNVRCGRETRISEVLFEVLYQAKHLNRITGGAFEPAMLSELEAAGYDRSFELIERDSAETPPAARPESCSISQLRMDARKRTVCAPAGLRIDLGGIGKGFTVDAAVRVLAPARDFVINAGGDLYASGAGPDGDGWLVNITDPTGATSGISQVRLYDQAL